MIRKSFSILFLWLCAMVGVAQTDGYDPVNPPNPDAPTTTYLLVTAVQPAQAGSSNVSGSSYTAGSSVYVYTYNNNGYVFKHWTDGTNIVSTSSSFYYTMPANNARLTAVYEYDPTAPDNPSGDYTLSHYLNLKASPSQGGSFNYNSNDKFKSGQQLSLYAYSNSNYTFKHWEYKGEVVSTNYYLNFTMPDVNAELVAVYDYTPATPQDPGTNFWNAETGELIVDAFTAGNLSNAIYIVTGGNTSNVQSLIVNGKVSDYDIGNMEGYPFSVVDFSRCAGATNVPSYSFDDNTTLTSISLPASITNIGYRSFSNCSALTSVSCNSTVPPTLESYVFEGIKDQLVIFVPATSIDLYQEAAGWKDLTILPLSSQVNALEVNLPAGSDDGRFKNMFIELVNSNSGQRMRYVISDRTAYTFQNLMHNTKWNVYVKNATGQILGQIEDIEMQTSDRSVTFQSLIEPQTIKAVVKTPDGTDVSGQMAFTWMTADGTYLAQGASVSGILPIDDAAVILRATLPQALAMQYQLLSDTTFVVQTSGNTITQTLVALPTAKLTGTVRDVLTNAVLGGANVTVSQTLNGKYSKAFTTTANAQGVYSLDAFYAPTSITAVATDYISQTVLYDSLTIENGVATLEDIALKSINGATITLNFTYTPAALSGSAAETQTYYSDYQNVAYAIRDITTGQDIKQFNVQYPQIVLLEDVALGDSLQLTATSKTGSFMPVVAKGKVNDMNRAEVTFDIKQLGQISATFVSTENSAVNGILYDSKGKFVKNVAYSNAALSFKELTDGDYTLITMGNSKLFNTIYDLSKFEQAGLKDGTDYVATPVKVQSGVISAVKTSYVPFFDESKLYYTGDNTRFTVNKTQVTAGNYLTINSRIDFKSLYANEVSNVRLVVDLPSTCSLVDNSVMVGSGLSTYISAAGRVTIPVDNLNDRIRFCVIPTAGGDYAPSAYVQFAYNGQEVTQPIGSANFTVKDLSINVPNTVARTSVPISGTAVGKSKVEIYDNGTLIGETMSLANGTWATTCELYLPDNLSTHQIYAKVTTLMGLEMQSETMACVYDKDAVQVNKVTMINTAHPATSLNLCNYVTVFDFQDPQKPIAPYWYWPSYPDFTFLVDIDYHDVQLIPFVWLHVFTSDGNTRSLRVNYDESKDCWITTAKFTSEALPTRVSVTIENMVFDPSIDATYEVLMDEYVGDIELKETVEGEDGSTTSTYTDGNGDDLASVTSYESDENVDDLLDDLKEDGFIEDELLDDDSDYVPEDDEDVLDEDVKVLTDPESGSMAFVVPETGTTKPYVVIVRLIKEEGKKSSTELVSSTITREWKRFFRTYFDPTTCSLITEYLKYTEHLDKYVTIITSTRVAYTLFVDYRKLPPGTKIPRKQILAKIRRIRHSSKRYTTQTKEVTSVPLNCTPPPPPPPPLPPHRPICPVMDPSGYVYEGVHSNRLEGVTATAYYKETGEDMYGDPYEKEVLWDAEEDAQVNPLFTDEFGMYAWDVPQGLWRVKFEKEGYQTTYSEWLPVPPPQLDVNIAMTQDRQPEVKEAKAYEDGVEIEFDKYMLPENLTTDNIIVKKNGEKIDGTIELLNSESIDENNEEGPQLASKVKFAVPEGTQLLSTDEVTLIVTTGVKSYVGLPMQETYTQTFDVEKAVRKIAADSLLTVLYEGTRTLQVSALPGDAAAGKTLRVRPLSTLIADISGEGLTLQEDGTSTITLDEEGQATLTVSGELPGSTALQFSIDDTKAEGQTLVKVQQAASLVTPNPRASRASGSAVYRGTLISLSCENENAKIWYTLDGTCPCDPATALVYSQPIAINDDAVTIKAMAQAEGFEESEVVTFEYTAKKNTQELALSEGWTWISHNVANNLAVSTFPEKTLELKSQTRGVIRDAVLGLFGNLQELTPTEAYKVKMSASATLPVSGDAFNASKGIISLSKGWNWIGYPMDQIMTPTEALANLSAAEGDMLVGMSGSADFIDGAWIGDLEAMTPGLGYMLKTSAPAELLYNTGIVSKAASQVRGRLNINRSPWSVDEHRYSNVMPMRAQLFRESGQTDDDEYTVAAFAGTECRGIGKYVQGVIFMNVHGEGAEDITFQAVHNEKEYIVDIQETLPFKSDAVGSYREPYALHLGDETVGVAERYSQLGVWPTMATTEITVSLGGKPIDRLTLTSTDGKMVRAKASGQTQEVINVTNLPAGIYIVAAQSGTEYFYKKIMKVNK
ncbi:MAG: chitobiase/beta-hexosaminidase C-terminal domain-containing protein [Prevotella sp.]|nr:chitobiase/beta-hexosaminidase C-terminal domain-containing protein [Prevotella sp.]